MLADADNQAFSRYQTDWLGEESGHALASANNAPIASSVMGGGNPLDMNHVGVSSWTRRTDLKAANKRYDSRQPELSFAPLFPPALRKKK